MSEVFGVETALGEPEEITMRSFFDYFTEAKRKGITSYSGSGFRHTLGDWFIDMFNFGTDNL